MNDTLQLGPRQRATIAAALTLGAAMLLVGVMCLMVWGLSVFVGAFSGVLLPPVVAGVLAMLLRPYYERLYRLCRGSSALALILFFISAFAPLVALLWIAVQSAVGQVPNMLKELSVLTASLSDLANEHWPEAEAMLAKYGFKTDLIEWMQDPGIAVQNVISFINQRLTASVVQMFQSFAGLFAWAVLPVYLAFFLMAQPFSSRQIGDYLPFLKPATREDVIYLLDQFVSILLTFFRGQIIIALLQGMLYAVGFWLVGLPYGLLIGFALGLLNVIPYLGSIAGLTLALPLAYFGDGGGLISLLMVLGVFTGVQCIEGYYLTPKIMGDRTGLHPAVIIFAIFFWGTALGGVLGMLLAIPLTAFAVVFWRLLKRKYIQEIV